MYANAGSRHGNGTYSRPTTLNSQPNHARRTSHTTTTITIIVPTKPKPNIAPPGGHIGHQGYPYRHDRPGFRLSSDQNQTITRIVEMGSVRSPACFAWVTGFQSLVNWKARGLCARSGKCIVVPIGICRCARVPARSFGFPRKTSEGNYLRGSSQSGQVTPRDEENQVPTQRCEARP
jgi:hypothetical protein